MRLLIQRVKNATVKVDDEIVGSIGKGILCFVGISTDDKEKEIHWAVRKVLGLKLWPSEEGKPWKKNVVQNGYQILLVSQPDTAKVMYAKVVEEFKKGYQIDKIGDGKFGAMMDVSLCNDGPVTFHLDSSSKNSDSLEKASQNEAISFDEKYSDLDLTKLSIYLTRLEKKIAQIVALENKVAKGAINDLDLDAAQQAKLASKRSLIEEVEYLKSRKH
eukprot:maker-scaffold_13-augustus-gene-4.59-mRNA-1 protein AED:0.09 eAED:0.09 QI:0/0/0.5/1/1/1/2/16/216